MNSRAEFPIKIYHCVSRNSFEKFASAQKSAKIIFNLPNRHKKSNWPKKAKLQSAFYQK